MRPRASKMKTSRPGYVIALAGTHWLLFDAAGGYLGTVPSPRSGLGFGRGAPTVLLVNRAQDLERDEVSNAHVGVRFVVPVGSIEPQACCERHWMEERC